MVRTLLTAVAAITATFGLAAGGSAYAAQKLTVYTAYENEQLAPYKKAFESAHPDIEIQWVRDSTGIITARLLAEKAWYLIMQKKMRNISKDGLRQAIMEAGAANLNIYRFIEKYA